MAIFDLDRALEQSGKAIGPHPALSSNIAPVSVYSPGATRQDAVISQQEAGRHGDAYGGGQAIDHVYDCIGLYADAASTARYRLEKPDGTHLVRKKTKGTPPEYEEGPEALYQLLEKPNPFMLYEELMSLLVIDLLLVGNAYWYRWNAGTPSEALYRLTPAAVKIVPGTYGPKRYEYQPAGASRKLTIKLEEMIHFRRANPNSAYYGMGVIQGAGRAMDLELAITDTMAHYYENRADPSMIVQSERRVPRDVFSKLRAQLRSRAGGTQNAGELLVLEAGLKASSLSPNARDALFAELSKMSRDRVYAKFRASPMLFGIIDSSSGSNKVTDMRRDFDNAALRPFLARLSDQITASLAAAWDVKFIIEHRSVLPAEEAIKVAESVAKMPGVKIREVRKQYEQWGIEESTGDPDVDELVINLPGENMDEDGEGVNGGDGLADQPLGTEAGRPPLPENTAAITNGAPGGAVKAGKSLEATLEALEAKALNPAGESVSVGNRLPNEQRPADTFAAARTADINSAMQAINAGLEDAVVALERDLMDTVEGKALKTSDLVSRIRNAEAWKKFRTTVEDILRDGVVRAASSGVIQSGLTPEEDIDYDALADSIIHRKDGLNSIIRTLKDRVVNSVKEARDSDAERADFNAAIQETLSNWSSSQAELIADTEATHAYNEATLVASEMSNVNFVFVTDGDDHDAPCKDANGSVWSIAEAREKRLEHPKCRRAFLPIPTVD